MTVGGIPAVASGVAQRFCFVVEGADVTTVRGPGFENLFSCFQQGLTEQVIWIHEIAHLYGVDHLDAIPSTINSNAGTTGVYSCSLRNGRPVAKPDGEVMAAIYNHFHDLGVLTPGNRPTTVDVGLSPFFAMSPAVGGFPGSAIARTSILRVFRQSQLGQVVSGTNTFQILNLRGLVGPTMRIRVLFEPMSNSYSPATNGDTSPSTAAIVANAGVDILGSNGPPGFEYWKTGNQLVSVNWSIPVSQLIPEFTYWMLLEVTPVGFVDATHSTTSC